MLEEIKIAHGSHRRDWIAETEYSGCKETVFAPGSRFMSRPGCKMPFYAPGINLIFRLISMSGS